MSKRQVALYAPDGAEVVYETSSKWDIAGIVRRGEKWSLVAHGFSYRSVLGRTITYFNRNPGLDELATAMIWEATAPVVREYFGHHRVVISAVFDDSGWHRLHTTASRAGIRGLIRDEGIQAIQFSADGRDADFQASELLASMNRRKAA